MLNVDWEEFLAHNEIDDITSIEQNGDESDHVLLSRQRTSLNLLIVFTISYYLSNIDETGALYDWHEHKTYSRYTA